MIEAKRTRSAEPTWRNLSLLPSFAPQSTGASAIPHPEHHYIHRAGWLRAAVLGANDGVISVASVMVGVAAASTTADAVLLAGVASLVAGAMSMAAGEYVSVSAQRDTERSDLATERAALAQDPAEELEELTGIYRDRGLDATLARQVAEQLTAHDDLEAHARDELGISAQLKARPLQAAGASAASFLVGGVLPVLAALWLPLGALPLGIGVLTVVLLLLIGALSARLGGAPMVPAMVRVTGWGLAAMLLTSLVGSLFGVAL